MHRLRQRKAGGLEEESESDDDSEDVASSAVPAEAAVAAVTSSAMPALPAPVAIATAGISPAVNQLMSASFAPSASNRVMAVGVIFSASFTQVESNYFLQREYQDRAAIKTIFATQPGIMKANLLTVMLLHQRSGATLEFLDDIARNPALKTRIVEAINKPSKGANILKLDYMVFYALNEWLENHHGLGDEDPSKCIILDLYNRLCSKKGGSFLAEKCKEQIKLIQGCIEKYGKNYEKIFEEATSLGIKGGFKSRGDKAAVASSALCLPLPAPVAVATAVAAVASSAMPALPEPVAVAAAEVSPIPVETFSAAHPSKDALIKKRKRDEDVPDSAAVASSAAESLVSGESRDDLALHGVAIVDEVQVEARAAAASASHVERLRAVPASAAARASHVEAEMARRTPASAATAVRANVTHAERLGAAASTKASLPTDAAVSPEEVSAAINALASLSRSM